MDLLPIRQGRDLELPGTWTASDGTPYDLDDYAMELTISIGGEVYHYLSGEDIDYTDPTGGEFLISIPRADTALFDGTGRFELTVTRIADDKLFTIGEGDVQVADTLAVSGDES